MFQYKFPRECSAVQHGIGAAFFSAWLYPAYFAAATAAVPAEPKEWTIGPSCPAKLSTALCFSVFHYVTEFCTFLLSTILSYWAFYCLTEYYTALLSTSLRVSLPMICLVLRKTEWEGKERPKCLHMAPGPSMPPTPLLPSLWVNFRMSRSPKHSDGCFLLMLSLPQMENGTAAHHWEAAT